MRFKGKVAWWFYAIIVFAAIEFVSIIVLSIIDKNIFVVIIVSAVLIVLELFCCCIVFHNDVELQNDCLLIVFGFIKIKIAYHDIVKLSSTNNSSASLAASLDRIAIKRKNNSTVMIALLEKERFFHEMKKKRPDIMIQDRNYGQAEGE